MLRDFWCERHSRSKWLMHERDDAHALRFARDDVGHGAQREAVNDHDAPCWDSGKRGVSVRECARGRGRKAGVQFQDVHMPASSSQAFHDAKAVNGSPCARVERPREYQYDRRHR